MSLAGKKMKHKQYRGAENKKKCKDYHIVKGTNSTTQTNAHCSPKCWHWTDPGERMGSFKWDQRSRYETNPKFSKIEERSSLDCINSWWMDASWLRSTGLQPIKSWSTPLHKCQVTECQIYIENSCCRDVGSPASIWSELLLILAPMFLGFMLQT